MLQGASAAVEGIQDWKVPSGGGMVLGGCWLRGQPSKSLLLSSCSVWWQSLMGWGGEEGMWRTHYHWAFAHLRAPLLMPWGPGPATGTQAALSECITETLNAAWSDRDASNRATHGYQMKVPRYIIRCQWWWGAARRLTQMSHLEISYRWHSLCCHTFTERLYLFEGNNGTTAVEIFKFFVCWCSRT